MSFAKQCTILEQKQLHTACAMFEDPSPKAEEGRAGSEMAYIMVWPQVTKRPIRGCCEATGALCEA